MEQAQVNEIASLIHQPLPQGKSGIASMLSTDRIMGQQEKAETSTVKAGWSGVGYGKELAKDYIKGMQVGASTWKNGILYLVQHGTDKHREEAMKAASDIADTEKDETIGQSLKKRISESRRIFKYASVSFDDCVKLLQGKGTWHAKVTSCPTVSTKGRKKGQGAGKSTTPTPQADASPTVLAGAYNATPALPTESGKAEPEVLAKPAASAPIAEAMKQAEQTDKNVPKHITVKSAAEIVRELKDLTQQSKIVVLDAILFQLSEQKEDKALALAAKQAMVAFDKYSMAKIEASSKAA